jgi:hypothetical protein
MNSPSNSNSLSQNVFVTENFACPRFARTVIQKYQNNELINQCLQLVPKLLLSERSLLVLKDCDKADDSKNEIIQHVVERIQQIEITVNENKTKYYSIDGTCVLKINKKLFEDFVNALEQPLVLNQAKLRLLVTICHEFLHHKMHKYLLNDKWGENKDEKTPLEVYESGFYWEDEVMGGRVIKTNKSIYSFLPKGQAKINLEEELCLFLLNTQNYDDGEISAYSRKEKQDQQQLQSKFPSTRTRKIEYLYINLSGTRKMKKTKSELNARYRLTPNHPLFVEVTLINDASDSIIYPDLPQNCGALRFYLYKYNEDDGEMFIVDLPINENDWTCAALRKRFRATPFIIPDNVVIKPNESKTFKIKLMEITTDNEEENQKTGHYYLEVVMSYLNNIAMLFKIPSKLIFLSTNC